MVATKHAAKPLQRASEAAREAAFRERKARAAKILRYLKKAYPEPKSELHYRTPFQFVVAVILSAQCTDKAVNKLTDAALFKKYKTPKDFANANLAAFTKEISSIPFFNNKAKAIVGAAKRIEVDCKGQVPRTEKELVALPGVGYKTAHVILGELYGHWEGIATDTHVKRFAQRFDLTDVKNGNLEKISKDLESLIPKKDWKYVNNGLVLYGRYVCPARPHDCAVHPLTKLWPPAADRWPKAG
jgi:endonuclease-3